MTGAVAMLAAVVFPRKSAHWVDFVTTASEVDIYMNPTPNSNSSASPNPKPDPKPDPHTSEGLGCRRHARYDRRHDAARRLRKRQWALGLGSLLEVELRTGLPEALTPVP